MTGWLNIKRSKMMKVSHCRWKIHIKFAFLQVTSFNFWITLEGPLDEWLSRLNHAWRRATPAIHFKQAGEFSRMFEVEGLWNKMDGLSSCHRSLIIKLLYLEFIFYATDCISILCAISWDKRILINFQAWKMKICSFIDFELCATFCVKKIGFLKSWK